MGLTLDYGVAMTRATPEWIGPRDETPAPRRPCHGIKTRADVAEKSTVARKRAKHLGLHRPRQKIPYRRFNGEPVWK